MEDIMNLRYALDTFYFLVMGAFVMWMAAGFAMLEAGLVRAKNTTEILTKNVALYAIALGLEGKVEKLLAANAPTNNDNNNPSTNPVSENPDNDSLAELEQAAENGFTLAQAQLGLMHLTS